MDQHTSTTSMMIGRTVGKYKFIGQLGRGGMGTVYRAVDETLDREVAIKMLNAELIEPETAQRFRAEAVALARLTHPRIATIHELTREGEDLLMVMELVPGETFEKLVARQGALPIPRAVTLMLQLLDALDHAHRAGIVHRDLKPSNLMVTPSGDLKVMDFGVSRVMGSEHLTAEGYMVGTPAYMAPEQVRGLDVDERTDLYAAAVVLYRLLTGRLPFERDTAVAIIHSQLNDPPTPARNFRADLPDWLDAILHRGLAKDPWNRFQNAAEFRAALEQGLNSVEPGAAVSFDDDQPTVPPMPTPVATRRSAVLPQPRTSTPPPSVSPVTPSGTARTPSAIAARGESTVTLQKQHLAAAGTLLVLLVVGVGVLAYAALSRRAIAPASPAQTSAAATTTPPEPPPADPSSAVRPGPADTSSGQPDAMPSGTEDVATGQSAAVSTAAGGQQTTPADATDGNPRTAAAHGARADSAPALTTPPSPAPPGPAAGARSSLQPPVVRTSTTQPSGAAGPKPPRPAATASTSSGTVSTPAAVSPPSAASTSTAAASTSSGTAGDVATKRATLPSESFGDVKALFARGAKAEQVDVLLGLEADHLVVRSKANGAVLKSMPYGSLGAASYSDAKQPKWQDNAGLATIPDVYKGSGFFLKRSKHWLTLQSNTDFVVLQLDDKNVQSVLPSLEAHTGVTVLKVAEK